MRKTADLPDVSEIVVEPQSPDEYLPKSSAWRDGRFGLRTASARAVGSPAREGR